MNRLLLLLKLFLTSTQRSHLAALDDAAGRYVLGGQRAVLPLPQPTAAKLFRSLPAIWKFDSFNSFENVSVSRYLMNFFFVCVLLLLVANCPRINEQVAPLPAVSSGSAVVISEVKLNDFNSIKIPF